jgi:hypothetical protein
MKRLDAEFTSGEFYGPNSSPANLELLARFFEKYPGYAEKTFLSVKVCHIHVFRYQGLSGEFNRGE